MKERRYKMLLLEEQFLVGILQGQITIANFDLPDDAWVVHVSYDFARAGLAVIIASKQFDPVPLGLELPLLPPFALRMAK